MMLILVGGYGNGGREGVMVLIMVGGGSDVSSSSCGVSGTSGGSSDGSKGDTTRFFNEGISIGVRLGVLTM